MNVSIYLLHLGAKKGPLYYLRKYSFNNYYTSRLNNMINILEVFPKKALMLMEKGTWATKNFRIKANCYLAFLVWLCMLCKSRKHGFSDCLFTIQKNHRVWNSFTIALSANRKLRMHKAKKGPKKRPLAFIKISSFFCLPHTFCKT